MSLEIRFKKTHPDVILPKKWSEEAVGYDLRAFILTEDERPSKALIPPRTTRSIGTRLFIELPQNYYAQICSRNGLLERHSLFVTKGIIDPDYRGEVRVLLYNGGMENYYVEHQEQIAQLILCPARYPKIVEVSELSPYQRGDGSFGPTGG